jgi:hypothetical protein
MGHSFKVLKMNFYRYFNVFYDYFLKTIYWGSVPTIILYGTFNSLLCCLGLFTKPYSPIILAFWHAITGQEEQPDLYGMPPQGGYF